MTEEASPERLFYDGTCGLCHWAVRFVIARDPSGRAFRFAPLDSDTFRAAAPESARASLPDSLVVQTQGGALLSKSAGVLHILERLGGFWRLVAAIGRTVPPALRDAAYDFIARIRHRLFARPAEACPLIPPALRDRFDG
jgi:predicted DCC family thiol-disulfide oxidoreductase YuxK